jgi:hypothetical protein
MDEKKGKGESKDAFSLRCGKLTVGPSGRADQGSAYDAMNSEETGKDSTGSGTYGEGGKGNKSKTFEWPGQ